MRSTPSGSVAPALACLTVAMALAAGLAPGARALAAAPFDGAQVLARYRELREAYTLRDSDKLWRALDVEARSAIGDREKFGILMDGLFAQTGPPGSCPAELVTHDAGLWVVSSLCSFEKTPQLLNLVFVFKDDGQVWQFWVRPDAKPYPTTHQADSTRTVLHLPFHGTWMVFWGGRTLEENYHVIARDQRFAYDLMQTRGGGSHAGEGKRNEDYYCWLAPIIAPAAGTITEAVDGVPDNAPGGMNPVQAAGNHVVIDHGRGEFSLLAHFHRGSLRVKLGQQVAPGDTLGLCGNSGNSSNSSEPHLHYHLQNGPLFGNADGLPAAFVDYIADDKPVARGEPVRKQFVRRNQ